MTLEEALEQCTEEKPIGNRVGDKEALIKRRGKNCFSLQEDRPWSIESSHIIGEFTREEIKIRIADISFASVMDPNGWFVSPEKW